MGYAVLLCLSALVVEWDRAGMGFFVWAVKFSIHIYRWTPRKAEVVGTVLHKHLSSVDRGVFKVGLCLLELVCWNNILQRFVCPQGGNPGQKRGITLKRCQRPSEHFLDLPPY